MLPKGIMSMKIKTKTKIILCITLIVCFFSFVFVQVYLRNDTDIAVNNNNGSTNNENKDEMQIETTNTPTPKTKPNIEEVLSYIEEISKNYDINDYQLTDEELEQLEEERKQIVVDEEMFKLQKMGYDIQNNAAKHFDMSYDELMKFIQERNENLASIE